MNITVQNSKDAITFAEINQLIQTVGWGNTYYHTAAIWQRILAASSHIATIRDHGKLVSFGRIVEDGIMCMFYDICVHPDYQGKGYGSSLMRHLIHQIKDTPYISIGLFVWDQNPTAAEFYGRFGFQSASGMVLTQFMKTVASPSLELTLPQGV